MLKMLKAVGVLAPPSKNGVETPEGFNIFNIFNISSVLSMFSGGVGIYIFNISLVLSISLKRGGGG